VAVLDTNVVLDWLVFGNAAARPIGAAIEAGRLGWASCDAIRRELSHMLASRRLARWSPDAVHVLAVHDELSRSCPAPPPDLRLRCRDGDDQVFVDLARAQSARWLLTRDRALRALARRARTDGLAIVSPETWASAGLALGRPRP
jgi:predicted nucleic acid-binding protein